MAPAEPSLYDVLGVAPDAGALEVRRAYLRLARDHHPDFHSTAPRELRAANEREMQRINEAWEVLGDPERRRAYDARRREDERELRRSAHRPGAASYDFVPFDEGPDVDHAALLDDTPVAGTSVSRAWQVAPPALLLGGAGVFVVGAVVQLAALVALGVIGVVLGLLGFLATPALAIARSIQAERDA
jgi:curved DNA-binding protein CbpA